MSYLPNPALKKSDILSDSTAFPGADIALIYGVVDTEVAAIKAKTDNLPASPAAQAKLDTLATDYTTARAGYLDILNSDSKYILSTALTAPTVSSLARFIASGGTGLGTVLPASKSLYDVIVVDRMAGAEYTGTVSAGTAVETTLKEVVTTTRIEIKSIWLDLNNLTANATIKLYHKVDGTNYRIFETDSWLFATDDKGFLVTGFSINNDFKITITGTEGAGVSVPYAIVYQVME